MSVEYKSCLTVKGSIWNDANGNAEVDTAEEFIAGVDGGTYNYLGKDLYVYLTNSQGMVIEKAVVNAGGTYTLTTVPVNTNDLQLVLSTTNVGFGEYISPVIDVDGWGFVSESTHGNSTTQTSIGDGIIQLNTGTDSFANQNFGIQNLPETVVNEYDHIGRLKEGDSIALDPALFIASADGSNPITTDNGPVENILFPSFPQNLDSILLGGTMYTSDTWPTEGVMVPYDSTVGVTGVVIYPTLGSTKVIIEIAAVDNLGGIDNTPGSITINFSEPLSIQVLNMRVSSSDFEAIVLLTVNNIDAAKDFTLEESIDGIKFSVVEATPIINGHQIAFQFTPTQNADYVRVVISEMNSEITYTSVHKMNVTCELDQIVMYPNPTSGQMTVANTKLGQEIIITDMLGREIQRLSTQGRESNISLQHLPNGFYNLQVISSTGITEYANIIIKQ